MKIITQYWQPPIPSRQFDWRAYDHDTYDGEGPIGSGKTELEAVKNLIELLENE